MNRKFMPSRFRTSVYLFAAFLLFGTFGHSADKSGSAALLANSGFEGDVDGDSWPDKWPRMKSGGSWEVEDGNHFLRLKSAQPGEMVMLYQQIGIPESVRAIMVTWRMRVTELKKGKQPWFDARI